MLQDLRESGSIEQDADVVMFIYRDDYYNQESEKPNIAEIIISKNRSGPLATTELLWMPQFTKFANKYNGD
jgi:replicative DNA helicase